MPRLPRIDAPGLIQHVVVRGIEKRFIFQDHWDKQAFVDRLGRLLIETKTACFAWCLMDNHFHLLLRTGDIPLGKLMNRLLSGHGVYFNKRHDRVGHLFQNRYKSFVCQEESYLLTLIRYIHLNPLRANIVTNMRNLSTYLYCGHSALIGKAIYRWQAVDEVLSFFGHTKNSAIKSYMSFLADHDNNKTNVYPSRKMQNISKDKVFDQRVLGDSDFTETLIAGLEPSFPKKEISPVEIAEVVAPLFSITPDMLRTSSKARAVCNARAISAFVAQRRCVSVSVLAKAFGVTEACISKSAQRGALLLNQRADIKEQLRQMSIC